MKTFIFIIFFSFSSISNATPNPKPEERKSIAIPQFFGYSEKGSPGYFNDLLEELKTRGMRGLRLKYLPYRRAKAGFHSKKFECMAGGDEDLLKLYGRNVKNKLFSSPYHLITSRLFTSGKEKLCQIKELKTKSLIVIAAFPLEEILRGVKPKRVERTQTTTQALKMMVNGRADALISYYPTLNKEFEVLSFCPELILTKHFEKIHCHRSKTARVFIETFNNALKKMREDGSLASLYRKYYGKDYERVFSMSLAQE